MSDYYTKERYKSMLAVMTCMTRYNDQDEIEILLQLRHNTGYADNMWDFSSSGHVEANESLMEAAVRETYEELSVELNIKDLTMLGIEHKSVGDSNSYINSYFICEKYQGTPVVNEPDKCKELRWFKLTELPENIVADRKAVIEYKIVNNDMNMYYKERNW